MRKRLLTLAVVTVLLFNAALSAEMSKTMPKQNLKLIRGDEVMPEVAVYPLDPGFATDSPGIIIGTSYYDYQTNGSTGNRAVICNDGSKYFSWMNLLGWPYPPAPRHVYHNWIDINGELNPNSFDGQVSVGSGSGYTTIDKIYGNRAAVAYHRYNYADYTLLSVDYDPPGLGFFDHYDPPDEIFPQDANNPGRLYWPYIAVDRNDNIHYAITEASEPAGQFQRLGYCNSTDGGTSWSSLAQVDTVMVISSVMDASPISDRVVLAYTKTQDTSSQVRNDIVYFVSEDGLTWDWRFGMVNVTNYGDDPDSLWAYTDLDVIIDYDDYIHIVWTESWTSAEGGSYFRTDLKYYSEETGQIHTAVPTHVDSSYYDIFGGWNKPLCKMNLGVYDIDDGTDGIFMTYTRFDSLDISNGGYGNGEIYMTYTIDNGVNWSEPVNLTDSPTPDCYPGQCDSDHWSSLADVVDENLHIIYINDKDAGGVPQTEGSATENPVVYLTHPNPLALDIDEDVNRPVNFSLNQNYPNPFNASTVISFNLLETSSVSVEVFDITGAKVATLVDGQMTAGAHEVVWDASSVASGVYFYKLTANNVSETRQAVLIK